MRCGGVSSYIFPDVGGAIDFNSKAHKKFAREPSVSFGVFLWFILSNEEDSSLEKVLFWKIMHHRELAGLGALLPLDCVFISEARVLLMGRHLLRYSQRVSTLV